MSLRSKLTLVLLLLAAAPLLAVTLFGLRYFSNDKEGFIFELNGRAAQTAAREVERNAAHYGGVLKSIATVATDPAVPQAERDILVRNLFREAHFLAVAVFENGKPVSVQKDEAALGAAAPKVDPAKLVAGLTSAQLEAKNMTPDASMPAVALRQVIAVAGGSSIHAAALLPARDLFEVRNYADPYQAFLVDADGKVLAHPDPAAVASKLDLSDSEIVRAARDQQAGAKRYSDVDADGRKVDLIGAFARADLEGRPLGYVVIDIPREAATQAVRALVKYALGTVVAVLLVALLAAFLFARSVGGPLGKLTGAATTIASGNFDAELPKVKSSDELGRLATAFQTMQQGLKEREEKLREAQDALVQSEKMGALGQLAAGITHEVKNPLAGIIGFAQLCMKMAPPGSPLLQNLQLIEKEGKRSKEILENLLRFSRKEEVAFEPLDPNVVVDEAVKLVSHQLQIGKVKIEKRYAKGIPQVAGNLAQLQQVLMNFMLNAMHAMQPKGGQLTLSTSVTPEGKVVLEVKDEGSGISEENKKKLFTPFFTTKEKGQGTGLGLSVSYGIVKNHGGDIKVWSQLGVGTIFYVYLPARRVAQRATA